MKKITIERRIEDWMVTAPDADLRALAGKIDFVLRYRAGGDPKTERKPRSDKGTKREKELRDGPHVVGE